MLYFWFCVVLYFLLQQHHLSFIYFVLCLPVCMRPRIQTVNFSCHRLSSSDPACLLWSFIFLFTTTSVFCVVQNVCFPMCWTVLNSCSFKAFGGNCKAASCHFINCCFEFEHSRLALCKSQFDKRNVIKFIILIKSSKIHLKISPIFSLQVFFNKND